MSTDTQGKVSSFVNPALNAFREAERARLLLDRKEKALTEANVRLAVQGTNEDREYYFRETEKIVAEYDAKREKEGL